MGLVGAAHGGKKNALPKICHTYSTKMKLGRNLPYLKKAHKIYESRNTHLETCGHEHFFIRNQQIFLYQKIQI